MACFEFFSHKRRLRRRLIIMIIIKNCRLLLLLVKEEGTNTNSATALDPTNFTVNINHFNHTFTTQDSQ